jgi:hypothetical protein
VTPLNFEFHNGDRVRLIDRYPVRKEFQGQEGTVVGDWLDVEESGEITVLYDFRPECEVWSDVSTLIQICDVLDTDKIDAFIEDM